jgi:polyisoprenoid-binding protein YceI
MTWITDTAHSQIGFSVKYMMLSNVRGHFAKFSGIVEADEAHPERSSVEITIDPNSISTNMPAREGHLRSGDFFDVENNPTATFRSTRIQPSGVGRFKVVGDLTIRGITREVPVDVTYEGAIKDAQGNDRRAFSATTQFNRKDFGLNWNVALEAGGFMVGDQVKIEAEIQLLDKAVVDARLAAQRQKEAEATKA